MKWEDKEWEGDREGEGGREGQGCGTVRDLDVLGDRTTWVASPGRRRTIRAGRAERDSYAETPPVVETGT